MMKFLFKHLGLFVALFLIASCMPSPKVRFDEARTFAYQNGFAEQVIRTNDFSLLTFQKISDRQKPVVYYIEGDGHAFTNQKAISEDPTPITHMVLKLAAKDKRPNIIYITRPCQYSSIQDVACQTSDYWTTLRMNEKVVDNINQVITQTNLGKSFDLIGFSGGGGIAMLIAQINPLTKSITTIAGNLDHVSFNRHHNVNVMLKSQNPIDYVNLTTKIPQLHLVGNEDKIVPSFITKNYVEKANSPLVKMKIIPGVSHGTGWEKIWPNIME